MIILINVVNQKLKITSNVGKLISGTKGFIKFKFSIDDNSFDGVDVIAQFAQNGEVYDEQLDDDNTVSLPEDIVSGEFTLLLYGAGSTTIGITDYITLEVEESILIL